MATFSPKNTDFRPKFSTNFVFYDEMGVDALKGKKRCPLSEFYGYGNLKGQRRSVRVEK